MRIVFAGTPALAAQCLSGLLNSEHEIIAVYTQPDKPAGRGQQLTASPVKQLALEHQIPVYQPTTLRDSNAQLIFAELQPDIMIVAAYGLILPSAILTTPTYGCLNIHVSLLPRWRGAAPIQQAILAGDKVTGVTIMQMDAGLDTGDILLKEETVISDDDTSATLHDKLAKQGSELIIKALRQLAQGQIQKQKQDDSQACYAGKINKADAKINWQQSAWQISRMIRAYNPWPVAFTQLGERIIKIYAAQVLPQTTASTPGTILSLTKDRVLVATGDGVLALAQVQLPGKKVLDIKDVLNAPGHVFQPGVVFDAN